MNIFYFISKQKAIVLLIYIVISVKMIAFIFYLAEALIFHFLILIFFIKVNLLSFDLMFLLLLR